MGRNITADVLEDIRKECQLVGASMSSKREDNRIRVTLYDSDGNHRTAVFADIKSADQHARGNVLTLVRRKLTDMGFDVTRAHMKKQPAKAEEPMATKPTGGKCATVTAGRIALTINAHGAMKGDVWHYADSWNDTRVAAALGTTVKEVADLRREVFGPTETEENERTEGLGMPYVHEKLRAHDRALEDISAKLDRLLADLGADEKPATPLNGAAHHVG